MKFHRCPKDKSILEKAGYPTFGLWCPICAKLFNGDGSAMVPASSPLKPSVSLEEARKQVNELSGE